jgi:hypothetical protein
MAVFEVHYSKLVNEFYSMEIEADSEQEARLKFLTTNEEDRNDFDNFEELVLLHIHIEQVLEIENEEN